MAETFLIGLDFDTESARGVPVSLPTSGLAGKNPLLPRIMADEARG